MQNAKVQDLEHCAGAKYAAEFIGTFFLVFTIGGNVHTGSLGASLSIGAVLMAMVFALGSVSGAHLNPAVTLAVALSGRGKITPRHAAGYMLAQLFGGVTAAVACLCVFGSAFLLQPVGLYSIGQAAAVELLFTAALCYVVLNVATTEARFGNGANGFFGIAIGFTVVSAAIAVGPVSGCGLNPAVVVGTISAGLLAHGTVVLRHWAAYLFSPFGGACLGTGLFVLVRGGFTQTIEYPSYYELTVDEEEPEVVPRPARPTTLVPAPPVPVAIRSRDIPTMGGSKIVLQRRDSAYFSDQTVSNDCFCGLRWSLKNQGASQEMVDVDVSAVKFNKRGKCMGVVYFADKDDSANGIRHFGDDITGTDHAFLEEEDSEKIGFKVGSIRPNVEVVIIVASIFSAGVETFQQVENFSVRVVDVTAKKTLCEYDKKNVPAGNAMVVAMIYRRGQRWAFKAIDEAMTVPEHGTARAIAERGDLAKFVTMAAAESEDVLC